MEISGLKPDTIGVGAETVQHARSIAARSSGLDHVYARYLKRAIDIVGALIFLVLLSPVFLVVAILIWRTTPGGVIFRQTRLGKNLVPFTCYKFRSMVSEAEAILQNDQSLKSIHAANWKIHADPRVTKLGNILRKTSIDELPQLINVLKGEMSLVGPRPYMPRELEAEFGHHAALITSVRPGMTGLWQTSGRALLTPEKRIELDSQYVRTHSARLDIVILVKTIAVVVLGAGAF